MNAQERDLLQSFLREVGQSRPSQKDPLAEAMIHSALAENPDALYVLVQRALAAETALRMQAQAPLEQGHSPSGKALGAGSFLGTAASVATGVVAGGFLFEGIQAALGETGIEEGLSDGLNSLGDLTDWA
jgi:hypothetical protein